MITVIVELIKSGLSFFQNKSEKEKNKETLQIEETHETNREEIKKGFNGRNFMFFVFGVVVLWNYVLIPLLDAFGIVLFSLPLGEIFALLRLMLGGV